MYLSASELLLCHAAAAGLQHAGVDHLHPGAGLAAAGAQGLDLEHGIAVNNVNISLSFEMDWIINVPT